MKPHRAGSLKLMPRRFLHNVFGRILTLPPMVSLGSGKRVLFKGGRLEPEYLITVPVTAETPNDAP
jgi:hypothetical protein